MVDHAEWLRVQRDGAGLALRADALGPLGMPRRAVALDSVKGLRQRRDVGAAQLGLVGGRVDFAQMRVEGGVFDLLVGEVGGVKGVERLAVVAHALGAVAAHFVVAPAGDLAVQAVEAVVEGVLLDNLPGPGYPLNLGVEGKVLAGQHGFAVELARVDGRTAVGAVRVVGSVRVCDEDEVAVPLVG